MNAQFDILIKNTTIIDGSGKSRFTGNVGIRGEKILTVGEVEGEGSL